MTKRRWHAFAFAVAGVFGVVAGTTLLVLVLLLAGPGVTKANFDRIKAGMSRAEVEMLFGRPADARYLHGGLKIRHTVEVWHGVEGEAEIVSDEAQGVVADEAWSAWSPRDEGILQRVRRLLGLSEIWQAREDSSGSGQPDSDAV
jgi:hypothetical protein